MSTYTCIYSCWLMSWSSPTIGNPRVPCILLCSVWNSWIRNCEKSSAVFTSMHLLAEDLQVDGERANSPLRRKEPCEMQMQLIPRWPDALRLQSAVSDTFIWFIGHIRKYVFTRKLSSSFRKKWKCVIEFDSNEQVSDKCVTCYFNRVNQCCLAVGMTD
jgi:hypothetical protein